MILFPPAKINLGLNVLFKREDGFHELDSCMVPIPLTDVLEILKSDVYSFHQSGLEIPGSTSDNLCTKAFDLISKKYSISPVSIYLRKQIPMGAGLGGGSSDAAWVLLGLNQLFQLNCSVTDLEGFAAELGSDCAFFIKNKIQIAKGRGEILSPCNLSLEGYYLKIINPGIHVGTKEAFSGIVLSNETVSIQEIIENDIENWKRDLKNDFESSVFALHPVLVTIKVQLYKEGAIYAAMSGSGSTLFGIYQKKPNKSFESESHYLELIMKL